MKFQKHFRIFSRGSIEVGGYQDNSYVEPGDRSGAMIIFDAWDVADEFRFRIYHPAKDFPIELKGNGFKIIDRESTYLPDTDWETGKELDHGEYLTKISFGLIEPTGQVEVECPKRDWDDSAGIKWNGNRINDLFDCKAELTLSGNCYKIKEILSDKQRKTYALSDRIYKLKGILKHNRLFEAEYELNIAHIHGGFELVDGDY